MSDMHSIKSVTQDGVVRNNCFNNTYSLDQYLRRKGVGPETVLYVASSWKEATTEVVRKVGLLTYNMLLLGSGVHPNCEEKVRPLLLTVTAAMIQASLQQSAFFTVHTSAEL